VDDLLVPVLEKVGAAVIVALVGVFLFKALGVDLSFLLAGGLVLGLVVSFAAQDTLSNFFAGIFILIDQPFREGDELMLETGEICRVDDIGLRTTKLFHFKNNQQMILPNNELATKRIINMSYPDPMYRLVLDVGVAYGSDLRKVKGILDEVGRSHESVIKDERHAPSVFVKEFGDSSINFEVRVFIPSSRHRNPVATDLIIAIKDAFDKADIEIPFPQRDIWMRSAAGDEAFPPTAREA
jgi:small-conductance mechanosensitive channel